MELRLKRQRRIEVARQEGALTEVEIAALARQVRRRTREALYRVLLSRAETNRLARVVQLAQRVKQIARERFEAGAIPQLEVIQAGLEVSRAQADLQVAQQREKVYLSQLNALLRRPVNPGAERANASDTTPSTGNSSNRTVASHGYLLRRLGAPGK